MKNTIFGGLTLVLMCGVMFLGLQACDHEAEQNEIKNRQWVQDSKDGKPFTNYGE